MEKFILLAESEDLWDGEMASFSASGKNILLIKKGGKVFAYEDRCPHQAFPLSLGLFEDTTLVCGAHHWEFDVFTGNGKNPQKVCLKKFPTKIEDGKIWVEVERGEKVEANHEV